jgi:DNA-binding transcriptional regulator YiaG
MTGFELRALRDGLGISRSEAARLLQISETALRRFEGRTDSLPANLVLKSERLKQRNGP